MCFYQRGVRAYQRGVRAYQLGVATRTVVGVRLPTRGVRLPTTGVDEDGRRYAPTNEGCASTTDLLRCEVSSDHSDHVVAQKAKVQIHLGARDDDKSARDDPGDHSAIYRDRQKAPHKTWDQYPYYIKGKKREKSQ